VEGFFLRHNLIIKMEPLRLRDIPNIAHGSQLREILFEFLNELLRGIAIDAKQKVRLLMIFVLLAELNVKGSLLNPLQRVNWVV
jgi:hypothetical protein